MYDSIVTRAVSCKFLLLQEIIRRTISRYALVFLQERVFSIVAGTFTSVITTGLSNKITDQRDTTEV